MKATETATKFICLCGRQHQVKVTLLVKEKNDLERENFELRRRLGNMRAMLKEAAEI